MAASDIYIPENSDGSDYVIVTSVNILKPDKIMGTKAIAVGNTNVYMSEDNLYLCVSKSSEEDISDTKEGKKYISKIDIKDKDVKIRKEYKKYLKKAYPDINFNEVYAKEKVVYVREKSNTEIIKIQCKDGNLKIIADGVVDGTIDDNLSVDEYKGHIRMVTTVNDYKNLVSRIVVYNKQDEVIGYEDIYNEKVLENDFYKNDMHNNLYVLDSGMKVVSKTEGLAENEEIYSARFMGDYGYFVTYRNTDPLFAVDFSDIENPSIIGKLKISGYSDYLHFYGEDSLLGLGMNTENENNQEIKLDMYNIKNGKAELESRKVISGTEYSEALYNYKAAMVSYEKNIIGFMAEEYKNGNIENYYYIFGYDKENEKFDDQVEGRNSVIELLESGRDINKIYISNGEKHGSINKIIELAKKRKVVISQVDRNKINQMSQTDNNQGVIAIVPPFDYCDVEDILQDAKNKNEDPFVVILDGIEDPHNLGSIIRTAETAGVHGIIIPKRRAAQVNSTVNKVSAGAVEHMKIARVNNINETIKYLKDEGLWVCGTDMNTNTYYYDQDFKMPIAIVIGSEGFGMSRLVKDNCDFLVKIPMKGKITSLNAAVSAGIVMYEVVEQRIK